jgi:hypothetical protein
MRTTDRTGRPDADDLPGGIEDHRTDRRIGTGGAADRLAGGIRPGDGLAHCRRKVRDPGHGYR